jgi:hypothetical protein
MAFSISPKEFSMMDSLKRWGASALALGAALQLSGCLVVADDDPPLEPLPLGTLTVSWSIDGLREPLDCEDFGADRLELVIYDPAGEVVDELDPFCESFGISVDLPEGSYFADVTLVDSFDRSATLTETLEAIDIIGGTDLSLGVDFPVDSFL